MIRGLVTSLEKGVQGVEMGPFGVASHSGEEEPQLVEMVIRGLDFPRISQKYV